MNARVFLVLVAMLGAGCGASKGQLLRRASVDLECSQGELQIAALDGRTRQVNGCGRRAMYVSSCTGPYHSANCTWILNAAIEPVSGANTVVVVATPAEQPREEARIEQDLARDGSKRLKLYLRGEGWMIYVRATPRTDLEQAALVWRVVDANPSRECQIKLVANGMPVEVRAETKKRVRKRVSDYQSTLSYSSLLQMARSQRTVGQLCDSEVTLSETHLEKLREMVIRIREVQVLSADTPPAGESPSSNPNLL